VLRVIMSSSESRSKVAHCAGKTHEVTIIASVRQRFTGRLRAPHMPVNLIDGAGLKSLFDIYLSPCDTAL
jgi:hypothetical protein